MIFTAGKISKKISISMTVFKHSDREQHEEAARLYCRGTPPAVAPFYTTSLRALGQRSRDWDQPKAPTTAGDCTKHVNQAWPLLRVWRRSKQIHVEHGYGHVKTRWRGEPVALRSTYKGGQEVKSVRPLRRSGLTSWVREARKSPALHVE